MRSLWLCLIAAAFAAPVSAQTTPPAAPSVTAGAEFKGLRFDWDSVPGTGWYQFEYRAHQAGAFVQQGANLPATATSTRLRLPLHLFDWTYARYRVAACNSAGCTRSNEVSVSDLRRDAVGYFKASQPRKYDRFGADTDVSPDGLNFVAAAPSNFLYDANGNYTHDGGAVYVFRRANDGTWRQRARLLPAYPPHISGTNDVRVGISANGDTVVMGMPNYHHVVGDQQSGEVYVFRFDGAGWVRTRLPSGDRGLFGRWVAINDAGDTIATPYGEQGLEGQPHRVAIYRFLDGAWRVVRGLADRAGHAEFCEEGVMSRDGSTIAEVCDEQPPGSFELRYYVRMHSGPNWTVREDLPLALSAHSDFGYGHGGLAIDGTGQTVAAQMRVLHGPHDDMGPAEVQVFSRAGGSWSKVATLAPGAWRDASDSGAFGIGVALSSDGATLAIGDGQDNGFGTGPRAAPLNATTDRTGAVYIYRFRNSWVLANMVKPNHRATNLGSFGRVLSLNANGQTLLVGHSAEGSSASGIDGNWDVVDSSAAESGAVFLY
jgi:hypothetical protein